MKMDALCSYLLALLSLSCHVGPIAGLRAPPTPPGLAAPPAQWLEQKLDHFNASDMRTWRQRYWVNASHWSGARGPVFLMISGESEANPVWLTTGDMMGNAAKYGALALTLEHRYGPVGGRGTGPRTSDVAIVTGTTGSADRLRTSLWLTCVG